MYVSAGYLPICKPFCAIDLLASKLTANVYTDHSNYSYRMDGNNVDIDTENVELASEQIKYEALTSSISSQFSRMKSVL